MDRVYVMQLVQSYQAGGMTRREFARRVGIAVGSVSVANVLLTACAPITPAPPPVVQEGSATAVPAAEPAPGAVTYPGPEGKTLSGYLARPAGDVAAPGVIVLQEWWGLNDNIRDIADRFADAGYVALAPDLYNGVSTSEPDEARKLVMELDMAAAVEEIGAAADFLLAQDDVTGDGVGIVGFCMGGRLALMATLTLDNLAAAVPFYGSPLTPDEATQVTTPVLGLYGEADGGIAVADVRAMEEAIRAAGTPVEIVVYPGAQHAFFNDTRTASYDAEASADAWQRTLDWLAEYLP
jgi:carboxymethylenebutenolidase